MKKLLVFTWLLHSFGSLSNYRIVKEAIDCQDISTLIRNISSMVLIDIQNVKWGSDKKRDIIHIMLE